MNPFYISKKTKEVVRLTIAMLGGGLSRQEHERLVREILTPEPELPLGIGAVTEIDRNGHQ